MVVIAPEFDVAAATIHAPAKLNLTLAIKGKRADGFHELHSLVVGVGVSDRLTGSTRRDGEIDLACSDARLCGPDNLALQAAQELKDLHPSAPGMTLRLDKAIPVGGGLGGGSSDAAAALMLCNEVWSLGHTSAELAAIGAELGSDVPLFFNLPAAVMSGRGERVSPVHFRWSGWALLVFVPEPVSTPEAYRAWSKQRCENHDPSVVEAMVTARSADELMAAAFNDLEPAVLRIAPRVSDVFEKINHIGLGAFRISGAGSTLFQLHDEEAAARQAARAINEANLGVSTTVVAAPTGTSAIRSEE